jgi:hypothetical protein
VKWWPWRNRHNGHANREAADARAEAERAAERARRERPVMERLAAPLADLPADELASRMAAAFRRKPV